MRTDLTTIQVKAILNMLRDELGEDPDDQLLLDMLEGETDLFALARRLLDRIEEDEGVMEILAEQMAARRDRSARAAKRIDAHRTAIMAMMEAGGIDKLPLAEATCSLRRMAPKAIVTDESLLPDALCKFTRKPDMAAIKVAAEHGALPGVSLDNGHMSLTIRRK